MAAPRPYFLRFALVALLALVGAGTVRASAPDSASAPVPDAADAPDVPGRTVYAPTRPRPVSPFVEDLKLAEADFARREQALRELLSATSGEARIPLLRELEQLRRERPARFAEVQLRHARRRGDAGAIARLERRLALLRAAGVMAHPEGGAR